ncbi:MAG: murein lipoprotein [Succinivibrionaceae bacterium]|nr:murein lipoprotein [Succinivibrionaceae bacterium]
MNKFSVAVSALVLGSAMLAGCQNTSKLEADVQALSNKVDNLAAQVDALKSDVQAAQASADNANSRLDNMVVHYRK